MKEAEIKTGRSLEWNEDESEFKASEENERSKGRSKGRSKRKKKEKVKKKRKKNVLKKKD